MNVEDGIYWVKQDGEWGIVEVSRGMTTVLGSDIPLGLEHYADATDWQRIDPPTD